MISGSKAAPVPAAPSTTKFELIGRVSAGLAHELNGPIGISLGFAELATEMLEASGDKGLDSTSVAKLIEFMGLVESSSIRARTLSRQIWNFAKAEPGTSEAFDLTELLAEAAAISGPAVKVAQIEITQRDPDAEHVHVYADPVLCTEAFVRLFLDSPQSLPQGGTVYWETRRSVDGKERFLLSAEPWGTVPSAEWPVAATVRELFEHQGGTVVRAAEYPVEQIGEAPSADAKGWTVGGVLPVATAGE